MANTRHDHVWVIDTVDTTVTDEYTDIQSIRWVGATTAGHIAEIADVDGNVVWASVADAANFVDNDNDIDLILQEGFGVPTLGSGKLYIYTRKRV